MARPTALRGTCTLHRYLWIQSSRAKNSIVPMSACSRVIKQPRAVPVVSEQLRPFSSDGGEDHKMFQKQMMELHEEREALFNFTEKDLDVWGNAGGQQKHPESLMQAIEEARKEAGGKEIADEAFTDFASVESSSKTEFLMSEEATDSSRRSLQGETYTENKFFTHVTEDGTSVSMVDVGHKKATTRTARARTSVVFPQSVMDAFQVTQDELIGKKGPIFSTAKIAGIMAAKRTSDLIPLCHPLPLDRVHIEIRLERNVAVIECECKVTHKTGVEMEALTGASVAALTIYDMVKAVSHEVRIESTSLVSKTGGKRIVGPKKL